MGSATAKMENRKWGQPLFFENGVSHHFLLAAGRFSFPHPTGSNILQYHRGTFVFTLTTLVENQVAAELTNFPYFPHQNLTEGWMFEPIIDGILIA